MKQRIDAMQNSLLRRKFIKLPHELDETVDPTPHKPQPVMEQAAKDVARGLVDTGRSPSVDVTYKKLKRAAN